jgi:hypothetical protein
MNGLSPLCRMKDSLGTPHQNILMGTQNKVRHHWIPVILSLCFLFELSFLIHVMSIVVLGEHILNRFEL